MKTPAKEAPIFDPDAFRDTIATVSKDGQRQWIYPKKPSGAFHNKRRIVSTVLVTLLAIGPWLRWNGAPMFLLNFFERTFIVFGITFLPQDFHLFALAVLTFFVFIILFTVVFGRVWCGWACPQTIFMEMIFRKIEYWIEGDAHMQYKLKQQSWNGEKIRKRSLKFILFAIISFGIGNLMMSYLIGTDELFKYITHSPTEHWGKFLGVAIFSAIFFFVFWWFREQACIAVCPYGRLQGVLLNKDSMAVMYDFKRGEPRGKINKSELTRSQGDCIDCKQCVNVCPTGIDIRNGIQMECIGCTACIDACDAVMDKVGFERGLVRYDSPAGVSEGTGFRMTTRVWAYTAVLAVLVGILTVSLVGRSAVETTILRSPGMTFQKLPDGKLSNLYTIQVVNKTTAPIEVRIAVLSPAGGNIRRIGQVHSVPARGMTSGSFFLDLPPSALAGIKTKVKIGVYRGNELLETVSTNFLGQP